jgi:hypothetical protein
MMAVDARNFSFYFHPVLLLHSAFCSAFYPIMHPGECNLILYIIFFFPRNECCVSGSTLFSFFLETSVVDSDPHGYALIFLLAVSGSALGLRSRFRIQWAKSQNRNKGRHLMLKCWIFSLRAEGFSSSLDVLHGGIEVLKNIAFFYCTKMIFFGGKI